MTEGTWDLYWIVTHPDARKSGVARALVARMEAELRALGARLVRVETSRLDGYGAARAFYERLRLSGGGRDARLLQAGRRFARHAQAALSAARYNERVTRLAWVWSRSPPSAASGTPAAPPPPEIVEVRVVYKGAELPGAPKLDVAALTAAARSAIASSSGVPVREDGGVDCTRPRRYRLRVELEIGAAEDLQAHKGNLRALVDARLSPVGGDPSALSFEQTALAERAYTPGKPGEPAWQAHAEHAIRDCVGGVGARVKLAAGDARRDRRRHRRARRRSCATKGFASPPSARRRRRCRRSSSGSRATITPCAIARSARSPPSATARRTAAHRGRQVQRPLRSAEGARRARDDRRRRSALVSRVRRQRSRQPRDARSRQGGARAPRSAASGQGPRHVALTRG